MQAHVILITCYLCGARSVVSGIWTDKMEQLVTFLVVCLIINNDILSSAAQRIITTRTVNIRGFQSDVPGVTEYLGIPYAEAPIGDLRFQPPRPKATIPGVLDATSYGDICPQTVYPWLPDMGQQSEDCLFLNVFVPVSVTSRVPVMVFFHGGMFTMGSANFVNSSLIVQSGGVIVVTINYRLGILGFLSTNDTNAKGNNGLWDQILALNWVNNNIQAFGGDTSRITVFGESAGAGSIELLAMSPRVNGLFHRIIIMSGYALSGMILQQTSVSNAKRVAELLGCTQDDPAAMIRCLQMAPLENIVSINPTGFYPTLDGDLLPENLSELAEYTKRYEMMIGVCKDEGRMLLSVLLGVTPQDHGISRETYEAFIQQFISSIDNSGQLPGLYQQFKGATDAIGRARAAADLVSDLLIILSSVRQARIHAAHGAPTYMYRLDPLTMNPWTPFLPWGEAATHTDDLLYIFGTVQTNNISMSEVKLSQQMITYWTNFAKNGDPNLGTQSGLVTTWPQFDNVDEKFIIFDRDMTEDSIGSHMFYDRVRFWEEHLPIFGEVGPTTTSAAVMLSSQFIFLVTLIGVLLTI